MFVLISFFRTNFVYEEPEEKEVDAKMKQSLGVVEPGAEELLEWCLKVPQLPPTMSDPNTMSIRYQLNFMVRIGFLKFQFMIS